LPAYSQKPRIERKGVGGSLLHIPLRKEFEKKVRKRSEQGFGFLNGERKEGSIIRSDGRGKGRKGRGVYCDERKKKLEKKSAWYD